MTGQHTLRPLPTTHLPTQHTGLRLPHPASKPLTFSGIPPFLLFLDLRMQTQALHMPGSQQPSRMLTQLLHTGTCGTSLPLPWQSRAQQSAPRSSTHQARPLPSAPPRPSQQPTGLQSASRALLRLLLLPAARRRLLPSLLRPRRRRQSLQPSLQQHRLQGPQRWMTCLQQLQG